ncbi:uncharacterized protein LOC114881582 [Osmia bicornis bicornis]|uniref:uncharacterized protein LOC114881582 n=1 Tax=Osmia bicornis bicornis TaxID=1437191 RepID=UPI0010F90566|nr:uncharacterized protein LOC114881582 [Osmia bicornis bicornis]
MSECADLGLMRLSSPAEIDSARFYLPHHAVFKSNEVRKIRVVFNASQRGSNGLSLNDLLLPGPKLQTDITLVLTRWRFQKFAFVSDIVKMFRQILVDKRDWAWQYILWRCDASSPIQDFCATTVTYGTAAAPFLAIRTLLQLAQHGQLQFPTASATLRRQIYVNDIFAGADTLDDAMHCRNQII